MHEVALEGDDQNEHGRCEPEHGPTADRIPATVRADAQPGRDRRLREGVTQPIEVDAAARKGLPPSGHLAVAAVE
jgi:hypothetical protein